MQHNYIHSEHSMMSKYFSYGGLRVCIKTCNILVLVFACSVICFTLGNASVIVPKLSTRVHMNHFVRTEKPVIDYTCYDVFNRPYKGRVPHPSTCNYYLMCVESGNGQPIPQLQTCETDELFDMKDCTCVTPGNERCFDAESEPDRFKCAEPVAEQQQRH